MKIQLTKRITWIPLNSRGVLDYNEQSSEAPVLLKEWPEFLFQESAILETIQQHCPTSTITLQHLTEWHLSLHDPKNQAIFRDLLVGSTHKTVVNGPVRTRQDITFHLDFIA